MTILESILLGLIQGLTEFLPVSSSGHLVLAQNLFKIEADMVFYDLILHGGTLLAVFVALFKEIKALLFEPFGKKMRMLFVATLPTLAIYLVAESFIKESFKGTYLGYGFLFTAVLLVVTDLMTAYVRDNVLPLNHKNTALMGMAQGLATLPGISRSGSTLCTALILGVDRKEAASFSFLMAIPIILGGIIIEGIKAYKSPIAYIPAAPQLILGFACAAISGALAIKFMLKIIHSRKLYGFAIYLAIIGVVSFFVI